MVKDSELPPMFREDFEILYTAKQLEPTIERLHSAIEEDLKKGVGTPQPVSYTHLTLPTICSV